MSERPSRRTVKAWFDPAVFERMNDIRRARGLGWADVVAHGVAAVEEEVPPIHEQFRSDGRVSWVHLKPRIKPERL